jgi:hypothetical protein
MATFYDQAGSPVAYTDDGKHIFLFSGQPVAYLHRDSVYSFDGQHLGWVRNGWIYDHNGCGVFFSDDSSGGPLKPFKQFKPFKSFKMLMPLKALRQLPPLKPLWSIYWSDIPVQKFFNF